VRVNFRDKGARLSIPATPKRSRPWESEPRNRAFGLAGIHYRSDIVAGRQLAIVVSDKVIARAKQDGAD
jgi:hypothetical protein